MTVLKKNKNIIGAFLLFAVLTVILINRNTIPEDFMEVTIIQGDTLSQLAQEYSGDTPMNRWIQEVALLNNLSNSAIIAGEDIKIPVHPGLELDDTRLVFAEERD